MKTRVVVVEDEPLARRRQVQLLSKHAWVELIGEATDGNLAVTQIDSLRPDLVLLDIELPDLDGLSVLRRVRHRPAVIFTTAYDRYAVSAFEIAAVDYLLKPFSAARLEAALNRARSGFSSMTEDFDNVVDALTNPKILDRIWVRHGGRIVPVLLRNVERMDADGDYVALVTNGRRFLVPVPMGELEARVDRNQFVRVHRSHIVNLDFVESLTPEGNAQLSIRLRDGSTVLASRSASKVLRALEL